MSDSITQNRGLDVCADNARAEFGGMDFDDRIAAYLVHKLMMLMYTEIRMSLFYMIHWIILMVK